MLKISIITVVLNRSKFIKDVMSNIYNQKYSNFEHIIIDGKSNDGTVEIIKNNLDYRTILISEKDNGIYNAINKGINHSTGDIICLAHSDDLYANNNILNIVAEKFNENHSINLIYGDLEYVFKDRIHRVLRKWNSGKFNQKKLKYGWMIPHPTIFIRREVISFIGKYNEEYKISSDYDYILRCLLNRNIKTYYIPNVFVKMRLGGVSNMSANKIIKKIIEDYKIIKNNKIGGLYTLFFKNIRKLNQFF